VAIGNIGNRAARGLAWMSAQSLLARVAALGTQLLLARFLTPDDFGVVGLATTVIAILSGLNGFGVDQILQNRQKHLRLWATQAFIASASGGLFLTGVAVPLGALASAVYHQAVIAPLIWVAALSFPLNALAVVPQTSLQASLRFRFLATYNSVEFLVLQLFIVVLALRGFGAFSFVLPLPVMAAGKAATFWLVGPVPLRALRGLRGWPQMLSRSAASLGWRLSATAIDQGDYATLGVLSTPGSVGIYAFAFRLTAQPARILASNVVNVLVPSLVLMRADPARQNRAMLQASDALGLVVAAVCGLQAAESAPFFHLLFGAKWNQAILPLQILSFGLPLDAMSLPAAALLDAKGKFGLGFRFQVLAAPALYIFAIVGVLSHGVIGLAVAVSLFYALRGSIFMLYVANAVGIELHRVLVICARPILLSALAFFPAVALSSGIASDIGQIALIGVFGLGLYIGLCFLFARQFLLLSYGRTISLLRTRSQPV
jgi:O-antigen/teichoic acid export membrane protein